MAQRIAHLEQLLGTPHTVETEDGRRVPLDAGELIDAWLAVMAGDRLTVEPTVRWVLATAQVEADDWQMAQLRAAARSELAEVS